MHIAESERTGARLSEHAHPRPALRRVTGWLVTAGLIGIVVGVIGLLVLAIGYRLLLLALAAIFLAAGRAAAAFSRCIRRSRSTARVVSSRWCGRKLVPWDALTGLRPR